MSQRGCLALIRERLGAALALPPSAASTAEYAPQLSYGRHGGPALPDAREGAVLVLVYPLGADWSVLLTVRTSHLSTHAGQVSFPGGRIEPGESPEQAAIREYTEELGVSAEFEVLGRLPELYVFASNFLVTPVVAIASERPPYVPNPAEVAEIIELRLAELSDRRLHRQHEVARGPLRFMAPHLEVSGRQVWGATWIILGDLLERLGSSGPAGAG